MRHWGHDASGAKRLDCEGDLCASLTPDQVIVDLTSNGGSPRNTCQEPTLFSVRPSLKDRIGWFDENTVSSDDCCG